MVHRPIVMLGAIFSIALSLCVSAPARAARPAQNSALAPGAPPRGLTPSSANLAAVLAAWRSAEGTPAMKVASEIEVDDISAYGLTGADRIVVLHDDSRETFSLGPVTTESGDYHGQLWRVNENGILIYEVGVHKKDEIDVQTLRDASHAPDSSVTLAGEVSQPTPAYILKLKPPAGRLKWLYIDKATSLLDREDDAYPDARVAVTFDDYHSVDGVLEPWHAHISDGWKANDADVRVRSDDVNVAVANDEVAIPPGGERIVAFPPGVTSLPLPARVDEGTVVVRIVVNGRGLDFALDSGSSGILLDSDVARELGVKTFGQSVETTMGSYQATRAIMPKMDIGPLTMRNAYVDVLPFTQRLGFDTKIVGLLGFDFLANAVVSIDYDSGSVTATQPDTYSPPPNVLALPVVLDDGVPLVQVGVGGVTGDHFILDTGSDMLVIFSEFAAAHPDDVADQGLGQRLNRYLPFVAARGVGGYIRMTFDQLASYRFGNVNFTKFLAFRTPAGSAFESEDTDGLVGFEILQYFTVTLDYKDGIVYLKPGKALQSRKPVPTAANSPAPSPTSAPTPRPEST